MQDISEDSEINMMNQAALLPMPTREKSSCADEKKFAEHELAITKAEL